MHYCLQHVSITDGGFLHFFKLIGSSFLGSDWACSGWRIQMILKQSAVSLINHQFYHQIAKYYYYYSLDCSVHMWADEGGPSVWGGVWCVWKDSRALDQINSVGVEITRFRVQTGLQSHLGLTWTGNFYNCLHVRASCIPPWCCGQNSPLRCLF